MTDVEPGPQPKPNTGADWSIHSLNIHGLFFERWCEAAATASGKWRVRATRLPVEFPQPARPSHGREGELDLWVDRDCGSFRANLLIECKKNNPDFVDWVFFPRTNSAPTSRMIVDEIVNEPFTAPTTGWRVQRQLTRLDWHGPITNDGRETRGTYGQAKERDKTKTSNAAIEAAAHQVALSAKSIALDEARFSDARRRHATDQTVPWRVARFFPVIVTTANLFVCEFDASEVIPERGEIPLEKATLMPVNEVLYEYALPRHLQSVSAEPGALTEESLETFWRMHIAVVHSSYFPTFLDTCMSALESTPAPQAPESPEEQANSEPDGVA